MKIAEAVARTCSVKHLFLEMSQNSQENTCAKVSFLIKLQASVCSFVKRETLAQVFSCEFCKISKNTFSYRTPSVAVFKIIYSYFEVYISETHSEPCQTSKMECFVKRVYGLSLLTIFANHSILMFDIFLIITDKHSHLLNDIFDLRNDIILLKENNEKEKPADSNNKKDEVLLLKEKIKFLESENSFLKSDINIKQKVIDSILEHNFNLLNHQCCRVSENANNEIYQKSENKEKKLKKSPDKNKNRDSNRNKTNVTARKQNDKRSQIEDQDEVRDNKTPKKDIVIIGDSMIKYINAREISRSSSVKIRSHPVVTTEDLIDYVRPTARKNPKMMVIHSGTNDITNKVNTLQKFRKVINAIKENDVNGEIEIVLSSVIHRDDQDIEDEINELNKKLENLCKGKVMRFIDNSNIKSSSLNRSKLHLDKSGTVLLTKIFAKIVHPD